jgi:hypothetical protein
VKEGVRLVVRWIALHQGFGEEEGREGKSDNLDMSGLY